LQFVLSNPLVNVALVGMRTVDEVERNVATANNLSGRVDHEELHRKYPEG
jgi:aryl-alcohol dehydrogenase-like predicted oxidoreductase